MGRVSQSANEPFMKATDFNPMIAVVAMLVPVPPFLA